MSAPESPYPPLCKALRIASVETGVNQAELARRMGERVTRISRYFNDREPSHAMVMVMEEAMGLPSGWLWTHAGYLRPQRTFSDWLAIDANVSEDGKQMLRRLYEQLAESYAARHGGLAATAETPSAHSSLRASS